MRFLGRKNKKPSANSKPTTVPVKKQSSIEEDVGTPEGPWARLENAVRTNDLFKLTTVDGMRWIDPYTGSLHSAPFGPVEVALDYYRNNEDVWLGKKPRSLAMLHYHRLHLFLKEEIQADERLRLFSADRGWLNPFTGEWIADVKQIGGRINAPVLAKMAKSLVKCESARNGELLSMENLKRAISGKPVETAKVTKKDLANKDKAEGGTKAVMSDSQEIDATIITGEELELPDRDAPSSAERQVRAATSTQSAPLAVPPPTPAVPPQSPAAMPQQTAFPQQQPGAPVAYPAGQTGQVAGAPAQGFASGAQGVAHPAPAYPAAPVTNPDGSVQAINVDGQPAGGPAPGAGAPVAPGYAGPPVAYPAVPVANPDGSVPAINVDGQPANTQTAGFAATGAAYPAGASGVPVAGGYPAAAPAGGYVAPPGYGGVPSGYSGAGSSFEPIMPFREAFAESDDLDKWWQEQFGGDQVDDAKAKSVQQRLLRALPQPNGYELAAFYEPHDTIGGDFYDCVQIDDNRIFFILADVSGHGVGGALIVASALKSLRYLYRQTDDLIEIMSRLNEDIHDDLLKEQFITAFAGIIKLDEAELTCVCCGHHPAIIGNAGSATPLTLIGSPGMALGLVKGSTFARTLRPAVVDLEDGDILLQCTDGILEAMDEDDEAFGILRGYASSISRLDQDLQDLVDGMAEGADAFAGDQAIDDDVTIFALKVLEPNEDDEELDEDGEASDFDQSSLSPDSALSASKQSSDGAIERHEGAS